MIMFATLGLDKQIIASQTFTALLLMAVASIMLTIPVLNPMLKRRCADFSNAVCAARNGVSPAWSALERVDVGVSTAALTCLARS